MAAAEAVAVADAALTRNGDIIFHPGLLHHTCHFYFMYNARFNVEQWLLDDYSFHSPSGH